MRPKQKLIRKRQRSKERKQKDSLVYVGVRKGQKPETYHGKATCASLQTARTEGRVRSWTVAEAEYVKATPCGRCING